MDYDEVPTAQAVLDEAVDSLDTLTTCVMNGEAYAEPLRDLMAFASAHQDQFDDWLIDTKEVASG